MTLDWLAENVHSRRVLRGWGQRELARAAGTSPDVVSSLETCRHTPRPSTVRKIARALDAEVAQLYRNPAEVQALSLTKDLSPEHPREWLEALWRAGYLRFEAAPGDSKLQGVPDNFLDFLPDSFVARFARDLQKTDLKVGNSVAAILKLQLETQEGETEREWLRIFSTVLRPINPPPLQGVGT